MTKLKKRLFYIIGLLLITLIAVLYFVLYPMTPILAGYAARMTCTCHFVQGRSIESVRSEELNFSLLPFVDSHVDETKRSVTSTFFGISEKVAVYRDKLGCILMKGKDDHNVSLRLPTIIDTFNWQFSDRLSLKDIASLDTLCFDQTDDFIKKTRACLIIQGDSILYEKYADGYDKDTPQLGWSMTKSVTGTLANILIQDGKLSLNDTLLFDTWIDQRASITLEHLLHMTSGIDWEEDYSKVCSATKMLFDSEDMVAFTSTLGLEAAPGEKYEYSSGTSNLLAGLIKQKFRTSEEYLSFPHERLFRPLGMASAFIETDESGNYIGSSYMYASTRDWAKYGLLYLNQGNWEGNQLLDSSIVDYTFDHDPVSNGSYGTQFWHNAPKANVKPGEPKSDLPNSPSDMIYADGFQGQRVYIIPSKDVVIVRLGLSNLDFDKMVSTIISIIDK